MRTVITSEMITRRESEQTMLHGFRMAIGKGGEGGRERRKGGRQAVWDRKTNQKPHLLKTLPKI